MVRFALLYVRLYIPFYIRYFRRSYMYRFWQAHLQSADRYCFSKGKNPSSDTLKCVSLA